MSHTIIASKDRHQKCPVLTLTCQNDHVDCVIFHNSGAGACSCQHPDQSRLVIDCADSLRLMKKEAEQNATLDRTFLVVHQTIQIAGFSYKFSRYSRSECLS